MTLSAALQAPLTHSVRLNTYKIMAINWTNTLENAKGDLIALLDADDLWDSDKLQRQLDFMERDTDIVFLSSNLRLVDDINRKIEDCIRKRRIVYPKASDIYRENPFLSSSIIAKRSVVEDVGGFDESHELLGRDEWDLAIRVSLKYKAAFDGKHIAGTYRWHEGNLSHDILSPLSSMEYLRDKYDQYFPPSLIRDVRARDCYNVAKNALRMGELKVFEEHIKKASRYRGYYRWKGAFIRCKNLFSNIYQ